MTVIGITVLALGLVVAVALTLADPVLLSRINGEDAEGGSGRHIQAPPLPARPGAVSAAVPGGAPGHVAGGVAGAAVGTAPSRTAGGAVVPPQARRSADRTPQAA
ncbi:hypothetical protein FHS43_004694 [Streptosporangium becharense]|uniref:Uncharacterized protein n=1 Tax=Streptosporangium becharense TaxID=1816182 RepID=A0A7W9MHM4_9ACTN|nr:hypothetical protein [Streptosporangium becharense]MBB2913390.1 hypothetical protein [Streptosporangium becharense]MBB5821080.1 hypothetical protein [Streptosporangium becharense]